MSEIKEQHPVIIGITGASGIELARTTIEMILSLEFAVVMTISSAGRVVLMNLMEKP